MALDFGISTALQGRKDWASVRADKLMELQFIKERENIFKENIAREAKAREGIQEYMDQINSVEVLDQDAEALKGVEKQLRQKVIDGLAKYKGDAFKFQLMGGSGVLNEYKNSLLTSDEMLRAKQNKLANAQYWYDKYLGRDEIPAYETDANGEQREVTFDQQLQEFQSGERKDLKYSGSAQPFQYQETFSNRYADENNKYVGRYASREDVYQDAINQGAKPFQAERLAKKYEEDVKAGKANAYTFRYEMPPRETSTGGGATTKMWERMMESMSGSNMLRSYMDGSLWSDVAVEAPQKTKWGGNDVELMLQPLIGDVKGKVMNMTEMRLTKDKDNKPVYYYTGKGAIEKKSGKNYNISEIDIRPEDILDMVIARDKEGNQQQYIRVKTELGNREAKKMGLISAGETFKGNRVEKETSFDVKGNQTLGYVFGTNDLEGEMLIPVNWNNFTDAENRYVNTEEERFGGNNNADAMEFMQMLEVLRSAGQ